jgi:hypothetical protein
MLEAMRTQRRFSLFLTRRSRRERPYRKDLLTKQTHLLWEGTKTYEKTESEKGICRSDSYLAGFGRLIGLWSDERAFGQR